MQSGNMILLDSKLEINRTVFQPNEYDQLREFFSLVGAKLNEQIVFKKR
jgi:hypothetical protein